ncbi:MAG TPA: thioredoxin domain-containing protein [Minicystis sp.]|nr:thioredoxin domain-containing protein [Minicystis sp.]
MPNRLAFEASPYLLQHADNPVDWYPWGPEALEKAKREDKPILLSIGYAACHWCHVMEHESFEDADIARRMNELFVNVKVDREERPDLDQIYQLTVQLMGRSGGWPLTVFLTPDQRPFFAGTYFPPADRMGMPGFARVLDAIADAYREKRGEVEQQAQELAHAIGRVASVEGRAGTVGPDLLRRATRKLLARFDPRHGGFGNRPKFPNTMALEVMLRRGALEGDGSCKDAVLLALTEMRKGGIWDHLRGGFHRYSTDERWLVPHFEKMLYDNALLLRLYADGFRVFGEPLFASTARDIVGYLFAEMRDAATGAFHAAQDADSEGQEGKFFVWSLADLKAAIGDDGVAYEVARHHFGVDEQGNFEHAGLTVLHEAMPIRRVARELDVEPADAERALARARAAMLAYRAKRPRPMQDDKVLASWNGLLISALCDAGRALGEPSWIEAAAAAFAPIEGGLVRAGRVGRYLKAGAAPSDRPGFLDDQAYVGNAALDLYEATGDPRYASVAKAIAGTMVDHHLDRAGGGFFFTPDDGDPLIARTKDAFDQAIPSATSMAALLCLRVGAALDATYFAHGERQLLALADAAIENPQGMSQAILGLDRLVRGSVDVVLVGPREAPATRALADAAFAAYLPNRSLVYLDPDDPGTTAIAPLLAEGKTGRPGATLAYVCRGRTCSAPVEEPAALAELLAERPTPEPTAAP